MADLALGRVVDISQRIAPEQPRLLPCDTKICSRCGQEKPVLAFNVRVESHDGRQPLCRLCEKERRKGYRAKNRAERLEKERQWRAANPELMRLYKRREHLKRRYGISMEDYDLLFRSQEGRCAICGKQRPQWPHQDHLKVDHDHNTGAVRGLLCQPCNVAIAVLGDCAQGVRKALDYLER